MPHFSSVAVPLPVNLLRKCSNLLRGKLKKARGWEWLGTHGQGIAESLFEICLV